MPKPGLAASSATRGAARRAGDVDDERPVGVADAVEAQIEAAVAPVDAAARGDAQAGEATRTLPTRTRPEGSIAIRAVIVASPPQQVADRVVVDPPAARGDPAGQAEAVGAAGHVEIGVDVEQADAVDQIIVHPPLQRGEIAAGGEIEGEREPRVDPVRAQDQIVGDEPRARRRRSRRSA